MTAERLKGDFNADNALSPSGDSRSDDKGPEPEAVTVGEVDGKLYGFVGLERPGGIVIFDISNPRRPQFVDYVNPRDFSVSFNIEDCAACEGDCTGDCVGECESCKEACQTCEECPDGEDCAEECMLCDECKPKYESCAECTSECPVIAECIDGCKKACIEENCPFPGVEGRDPLDLGPEGLIFITEADSPAGLGALVVASNEVSGSTTVYEVVPKATGGDAGREKGLRGKKPKK